MSETMCLENQSDMPARTRYTPIFLIVYILELGGFNYYMHLWLSQEILEAHISL